jgi:hypothetical protein
MVRRPGGIVFSALVMLPQKAEIVPDGKVRFPRRGGIVKAEAYMWYPAHF